MGFEGIYSWRRHEDKGKSDGSGSYRYGSYGGAYNVEKDDNLRFQFGTWFFF